MDVNGKVAIVTGGAMGIGFEIVKELLKNNIKNIALLDINEENGKEAVTKLTKQYGSGKVIFIKTDVSNKSNFEDAFQKTINIFKKLDIVVNNAGLVNQDEVEEVIDINLKGTLYGTLLGLKYLGKNSEKHKGIIMNIASVAGLDLCPPEPIYCATKCGVVGLVRSYGHSFNFDRTGITVIALCPGATKTTLTARSVSKMEPEIRKKMEQLEKQSPDFVGRAAVYVIKNGDTGSAWIIENSDLYRVDFPTRQSYSTLVMKHI